MPQYEQNYHKNAGKCDNVTYINQKNAGNETSIYPSPNDYKYLSE